MKRVLLLLISILMVFSMCACVARPTEYSVEYDGKTYEVNEVEGTIFDGVYTYKYSISNNSTGFSMTVTYPDRSTYYLKGTNGVIAGYGTGGYLEGNYANAHTLHTVIEKGAPGQIEFNPKKWITVLALIAVGLFMLLDPESAWHMEEGWKFKNAEPSDKALEVKRVCGVFSIIAGIIAIFVM